MNVGGRRERKSPRRQRGVALLVLVTIVAVGASWLLLTSLSEGSNRKALEREYNARVLAEAKAALIGWIATNALEATERNPGRLPCPQAWGDVGSGNEGRAAGNCAQPAIGWLPWKTLGLPLMRDAAGEQLWYAISPGWHLPSSGATLTINSESPGQLSLDGQAVVALIIAPGQALNVEAVSGCTARSQSHVLNLPSTPPDVLDYLECDNASSGDYSYTLNVNGNDANDPLLNDQVVAVTTADVLPGLEAAITKRLERDIIPYLRTLYASSDWGPSISLTDPVYPYPAPLPTTTYQGVYGSTQGLFPASYYAASCGADPRCSSTFGIAWTATSNTASPSVLPSMAVTGGSGTIDAPYQWGPMTAPNQNWFFARGWYYGQVDIQMTDTVANVASSLRTFDVSTPSPYGEVFYYDGSAWTQVAASVTRGLQGSDGSFKVTVQGSLPDASGFPLGHGEYYLRFWRPNFLNHPLLSNTGRALGFTAGGSGGVPQIKSGATVTGLTSGASGTAVVVKRSGDWGTGNAAGDLIFTSVTGGPFASGEDLQVGGTTRAVASGSDIDIGWFVRNEWYRVLYYAVATGQTVASAACSQTSTNCLTLTTDPTPNDRKRALLVLMGRVLPNQTRPNAALTNYLETSENRNLDISFEQPRVTASVNDRVIVIDQN